jgi:hypothetical protein
MSGKAPHLAFEQLKKINVLVKINNEKFNSMGIINQSPIGTIKGAFGNYIGGSWKGRGYVKIRPSSIANPKTPKQQRQRARFAACTKLSKFLTVDILKPIWKKMAGNITGQNLFMKTNISMFSPDGTITDYENLKVSVGRLPLPENIVVQNDGTTAGAIRITWEDNSGWSIAAATDRLKVVYIAGVTAVVMKGLVFTRSEELATIQLTGVSGQTVHLYVFFEDEESETYSNSFHAMVAIPIAPAD